MRHFRRGLREMHELQIPRIQTWNPLEVTKLLDSSVVREAEIYYMYEYVSGWTLTICRALFLPYSRRERFVASRLPDYLERFKRRVCLVHSVVLPTDWIRPLTVERDRRGFMICSACCRSDCNNISLFLYSTPSSCVRESATDRWEPVYKQNSKRCSTLKSWRDFLDAPSLPPSSKCTASTPAALCLSPPWRPPPVASAYTTRARSACSSRRSWCAAPEWGTSFTPDPSRFLCWLPLLWGAWRSCFTSWSCLSVELSRSRVHVLGPHTAKGAQRCFKASLRCRRRHVFDVKFLERIGNSGSPCACSPAVSTYVQQVRQIGGSSDHASLFLEAPQL